MPSKESGLLTTTPSTNIDTVTVIYTGYASSTTTTFSTTTSTSTGNATSTTTTSSTTTGEVY